MDSTQFNNIIYLKELKNPLFIGVSKDFDTSKGCKIATTKLGYFSCSTKGKSLLFFALNKIRVIYLLIPNWSYLTNLNMQSKTSIALNAV